MEYSLFSPEMMDFTYEKGGTPVKLVIPPTYE